MLFSGSQEELSCASCDYRRLEQHSSAILYWTLLVAVGLILQVPRFRGRFGDAWRGAWPAAMAAVVGGLALAILASRVAATLRARRNALCPQCGSRLETSRTGFYDFCWLPGRDDIAVGVMFVAIQVVVALLVAHL